MEKKIEVLKDVVYGKVKTKSLLCNIMRLCNTNEKLPVVVYIHGGAWQSGSKEKGLIELLPFVEKKYCCVSISYRFSQEAIFPAQIEDCKCAIRFLKANSEKYLINPDKIGVWGVSSGGNLACLLGVTDNQTFNDKGNWKNFSSNVVAVCDWFGRTNFLTDIKKNTVPFQYISKFLGGPVNKMKEKVKQVSPYFYPCNNCPPFLIMHGDKDTIVPFRQSKIFYEKLKKNNVDVTFIKIKNAGHGAGFGKKALDFILAFFDCYLKNKKKNWKNLTKQKSFCVIKSG